MRAFLSDVLANFAAFWIGGWLGRKGEDRGKGDYIVDPLYQWVLNNDNFVFYPLPHYLKHFTVIIISFTIRKTTNVSTGKINI